MASAAAAAARASAAAALEYSYFGHIGLVEGHTPILPTDLLLLGGQAGRSPFKFLACWASEGSTLMILPQVHLRKPCYDFYFL